MRQLISANGTWRYLPDVYNQGETFGWHADAIDESTWRQAEVPCSFDQCSPELQSHEGPVWYRRSLHISGEWEGKRVSLRFGAVNLHAKVWVNGELVGENPDGFLPFDLRIDGVLRFGEENTIAVWADNSQRATDVPGTEWGWRNVGGIIRDVGVEASDLLRLSGIRIVAEPGDGGGRLTLTADVENLGAASAQASVTVEVGDAEGKAICSLSADQQDLAGGGQCSFELAGDVPGGKPWSPDSPNLYTAQIVLLSGGEPADSVTRRFGLRTVEAKDAEILLNGRRVYLTGFNRHEDAVGSGLVRNPKAARIDFEEMKRAGCNFVRLCHYPHDEAELDLCDELGLLVMCEIPLYWWRGYTVGEDDSLEKLKAAKRQIRRLIERDRNHPCVIFWSVSNECMEDQPEVQAGLAELVRLARSLDPTRLAVHVSCYFKQAPSFDADDVICVNDYPGWGGHGREGKDDRDFVGCTKFWRRELAKLHELHPDKPIVVTEFGHPSLEGVRETGLGEDVQQRAIVAEFKGMDAPYVCGAVVWCYADHLWPFTAPFVGRLTTSPYGVLTRERHKQPAFEAIACLFRKVNP